MSKIYSALTKNNGRLYGSPLLYLCAAILFAVLLVAELTDGFVYLKSGQTAPLGSGVGYFMLGVQVSFLLASIGIFFYKLKDNLER